VDVRSDVRSVPAALQPFGTRHLDDRLITGDLRRRTGEREPGELADRTAAAVTAHEPARADFLRRGSVRTQGAHRHPVGTRFEPRQLHVPAQLHAQAVRALRQQSLQGRLRDEADVTGGPDVREGRVRLVQQVGLQHDPGEVSGELGRRGGRCTAALLEESTEAAQRPLLHLGKGGQHPSPVERHGTGRVDSPRLDRLVHLGQPLDDEHPGPAELQLAGQQ
jgi:hypothetical protein